MNKKLILLINILILLMLCACGDDDNNPSYKTFLIEGKDPVTNQYTAEFKVLDIPNNAYVEWSVSNDKFEISRNSHSSVLVRASTSGVQAVLNAVIIQNETIIGYAKTDIYSSF